MERAGDDHLSVAEMASIRQEKIYYAVALCSKYKTVLVCLVGSFWCLSVGWCLEVTLTSMLATYIVVCRPRPDCLIVSRCSSPATFFWILRRDVETYIHADDERLEGDSGRTLFSISDFQKTRLRLCTGLYIKMSNKKGKQFLVCRIIRGYTMFTQFWLLGIKAWQYRSGVTHGVVDPTGSLS